jgi:hypothetical protein
VLSMATRVLPTHVGASMVVPPDHPGHPPSERVAAFLVVSRIRSPIRASLPHSAFIYSSW